VPLKEIGLSDADRSDTSNFCPKTSAEVSRSVSIVARFISAH